MQNPSPNTGRPTPPVTRTGESPVIPKPPPGRVAAPLVPTPPPLFRRTDWVTFILVTLLTMAGYLYTIAPDLTLEDSGELAVASMYAGVPHPPGYPVWTLYTYAFTKLLPFSNIAWRVSVSSAFAAAVACGLCALLVSRGSSMILEGIAWFKDIDRRWESALCMVSGFVAGALLGYNGFIWSQAVIVEVYTLAILSFMGVLACLFRWMYAPKQLRYLYWSFFWMGISICNHQTLVVALIGMLVAIIVADQALGRDLAWGGTAVWLVGASMGILKDNPAVSLIFHFVGIGCAAAAIWLTMQTRAIMTHWKTGLWIGLAVAVGSSFYLYMPLSSMTNPPLNWGYPRTVEGFIHAFTRGQYEKTNPTSDVKVLAAQLVMYFQGAIEEFNIANLLIALVPFAFWSRMQKRERAWLVGLSAIYVCLAFLLLILLNPQTDKQARELVKVFFTSSHVVIAMGVGYGIALIGACLLTQYERTRYFILSGATVVAAFNLFEVYAVFGDTLLVILRAAAVTSLVLSVLFIGLLMMWRKRVSLAPFLVLFALIPVDSILSHWSDNEQRGHLFGFWFGHDMFDPTAIKDDKGQSLYPEMTRDAVLFGGTDPGRFCPTYMIFCESFTKPEDRRNPKFDRRDVALITQNALADNTYLDYIRAHYNRGAQKDPPFFQELPFVRSEKDRLLNRTNLLTRMMKPLDEVFLGLGDDIEKERRAGSSLFKADHFVNLDGFKSRLQSGTAPVFGYLKTELGAAATGDASTLAKALNQLMEKGSLYDEARFAGVKLSPRVVRFAKQNPTTHNRIRLNRLLLEETFEGLVRPSLGGLYPDLEVLTPTPEDSARCFQEYMNDAGRRMAQNQLKPGELVQQTPDGRVSVSGQVAVMSINALLCRVIFDKNPQNEFFIEESFPLDWMYPYLSPFGIIMKINREPLKSMSEEMLMKDHEFWSRYSDRFIGNWISYDTKVSEIADFAKRVYLRRDFQGFKGDPKFVRDDNAQKSFSKLRGAIGGVYAWRLRHAANNQAERDRLLKEADFAFKQAWAYCPYSPEAVYRYVQLLAENGRIDDAVLVAETCYAFDSENLGVRDLVRNLQQMKANPGALAPPSNDLLLQLEAKYRGEPTNLETAFNLASMYIQMQRATDAYGILDALLANPKADPRTVLSVAEAYRQLAQIGKVEMAMQRYTQLAAESPEAWYDLAAIQAAQGKAREAAQNLDRSFVLDAARRQKDPKARDLRGQFPSDVRFEQVRSAPEFQKFK